MRSCIHKQGRRGPPTLGGGECGVAPFFEHVFDFPFPMRYSATCRTFVGILPATEPASAGFLFLAFGCRCMPPIQSGKNVLMPDRAWHGAIPSACDPGLGRSLLAGRCLVASERHPAYRVGSWVMVSKEPGAS